MTCTREQLIMARPFALVEPGTLLERIHQTTRQALAGGTLEPIATDFTFLTAGELRFLVRRLANLARKQQAAAKAAAWAAAGKSVNPFLPYDETLFVGDLSPTHLCLLNKYNVVEHHILIVTRAFEAQESWLSAADFDALVVAMAEIDGLAFYNGGVLAGSSQPHKHLQLVPLPLAPDASSLPLEALMPEVPAAPAALAALPFSHAALALAPDWLSRPAAGAYLKDCYRQALGAIGLDLQAELPTQAYNLLLTRRWLLVVARRASSYQSIPVNALGFAGSLLVKNDEQLALLHQIGPMALLQQVSCPPSCLP
jgi:sulfate adenylyltransferase (ADP) / ATP adenylyltransferase